MGHPVQQIAYRCCINFAKVNFRTEYSASAYTFVALCLIIGNYKAAVIPNMLSIVYAARSANHGERGTERRQLRQSSMASFLLNPFVAARTCL